MSTERQKRAARQNLERARAARSGKRDAGGPSRATPNGGSRKRISASQFAFPQERKEPLTDAAHVRNAIARFDQVEGVTDEERDAAWKRIRSAARKFDVEIAVRGWRQLFAGGKARKR
jgi:hypothetical protein